MEALNSALHELRARAGDPSARVIATLVSREGIKASYTRVHDVFVQPRLPDYALTMAIAAVLAERGSELGREREVDRFRYLWADARGVGYRSQPGRVVLSAPPLEPPEFLTPDDATERLARMILAAATPPERTHIVMILNNGEDPRSLTAAIEPIVGRLPRRDKRTADHYRRQGGVLALGPYLRRQLDGSAAQEKRELELAYWLNAEAHDEWGRSPRGHDHQEKRAIDIRCAGDGGACGKVRGTAWTVPCRQDGDPILILRSGGGSGSLQFLQQEVPPDFSGEAIHLFSYNCRHNGSWKTDGTSPTMPFAELRTYYEKYVRTGHPQTARWLPLAAPTPDKPMQ